MSKTENRIPLKAAKETAQAFIESHLFEKPIIVGSVGRGELLVGDIDLLVMNPSRLGERDDATFNGMQVNIWYTDTVNRESMQLWLDGPTSHNVDRAERARKAGFKYNIYGLWKDESKVANDKISIEKLIKETDGISEETLTGEFIKFAKFSHPSGDYLQIGSIRIEADKDKFRVLSVFELWMGDKNIKRYEKIKGERRTMEEAENIFSKWIEEKKDKGYKLVGT